MNSQMIMRIICSRRIKEKYNIGFSSQLASVAEPPILSSSIFEPNNEYLSDATVMSMIAKQISENVATFFIDIIA